jgi:hypothetical protein
MAKGTGIVPWALGVAATLTIAARAEPPPGGAPRATCQESAEIGGETPAVHFQKASPVSINPDLRIKVTAPGPEAADPRAALGFVLLSPEAPEAGATRPHPLRAPEARVSFPAPTEERRSTQTTLVITRFGRVGEPVLGWFRSVMPPTKPTERTLFVTGRFSACRAPDINFD